MAFIRKNGWYIFACLWVIITSILVYLQYELVTLFLFGLLLVAAISQKVSNFFFLLIILTPLSIHVLLPGGVRMSIPIEGLLLLISALLAFKILAGYRLKIKHWKHPLSILLLMDVFWTLITTLTSEIFEISFKRLIIKTLYLFVYFYLLPHFLKERKNEKGLFLWYGIGFIIPIIYATYKHFKLGIGYMTSIQASLPFYDEHTIYGSCATFLLPFFLLKSVNFSRYRIVYILTLGFLLTAFILSYSRASWLSLMIALAFFVAIKLKVTKSQFSLFFGVLTVGILLNFNSIYHKLENSNAKYNNEISAHLKSVTNLQNDASNLERINRWICAYNMFEDRPILGYGPGTYQFVYDRFQYPQYMTRISTNNGDKGNAHSEYLTPLSESGILGLFLFIGIIITSFFCSLKLIYADISSPKKTVIMAAILGLITFFVHGIFNSFIDSSKIAILVYGSLGMIASISQELTATQTKK